MRGLRGFAAATGLVVVAACLGACTTTTSGRGSRRAGPTTSRTAPSTPTGGPSTSTGPSVPAVPSPAACASTTDCRLRISASLSAPYGVSVYVNSSGATVVELTANGRAAAWYTRPDELPAQLSCETSPDRSNCVLVTLTGAHSATASVWRLVGHALAAGPEVKSATPTMHAVDLNGDGWVDAVGLQNDFTPSYAQGKVYWQTWLSDGTNLKSSGCTAPVHAVGPEPTRPLSGQCP